MVFGHVDDHFVFALRVYFSTVSAFQVENISSELDDRGLKAEANAEHGFLRLATPLARLNFALHASLAKSTWDYYATEIKKAKIPINSVVKNKLFKV